MWLLRESPAIVAGKDFRDPRDGAFPTALSGLRAFPGPCLGWDGEAWPARPSCPTLSDSAPVA